MTSIQFVFTNSRKKKSYHKQDLVEHILNKNKLRLSTIFLFFKYQRSTTSSCKDIGIRKSEFVEET